MRAANVIDAMLEVLEKMFGSAADTSLSDEYYETLRRRVPLEPEQALLLAVLEDGIASFLENIWAVDRKRKTLCEEAREWIFEEPEDEQWPFNFETCCEWLGLDPNYLRDGIRRVATGA